jgi:hypothetical protein
VVRSLRSIYRMACNGVTYMSKALGYKASPVAVLVQIGRVPEIHAGVVKAVPPAAMLAVLWAAETEQDRLGS